VVPHARQREAGRLGAHDQERRDVTVIDVSVVIPTYNRVDRLRRVLDALAQQTYPSERFEVVVVSDGSTDGTNGYLAEQPVPNLVSDVQENAGPAAARNRGVKLARGRLILFLDDDVVAAPDLVQRHVDQHAGHDGDLVVIGPMLSPTGFAMSPWVAWEQAMLVKQYTAMEEGRFQATFRQFYTGNASVPRARLLDVGGFDTTYRRAEDVELAHRLHDAGLGFAFDPKAAGYHYAERSFTAWITIAADYGANDVLFARQGHRFTLNVLPDEFRKRQAPLRWLVQACIALPWLERPMRRALRTAAMATNRLGWAKLTQILLSALYCVAYHRGVADALGGPRPFHEIVVAGRRTAEFTPWTAA
jgi:glycosyltransferase involved in cell wall biosynthesis